MFEVMQPDHQPHGFGRSTKVRTVAISKSNIKPISVDALGQRTKRMIKVKQLFKLGLKQPQLVAFGFCFGLHDDSNCMVLKTTNQFPCNLNQPVPTNQATIQTLLHLRRDD